MKHLTKSVPKPEARTLNFEAIGTVWTIDYESPVDHEQSIAQIIERFDATYSRFRADSWVTRIAQQAGTYPLPVDAKPMLDLYVQLYTLSDGAVTPLIGQTLVDAGYDAEYSLVFRKKTTAPQLLDMMRYDETTITLDRPALLDFGAVGKGYLVDLISDYFISEGIGKAVIDAGGDIRHLSDNTDRHVSIALQHPTERSTAIGVVKLSNQSICGSSTQLRTWNDTNHIIDARTGSPVKAVTADWVVADSAMLADGISTALFFVAPDVLSTQFSFEYAILKKDYSLAYSTKFPARFFKENN